MSPRFFINARPPVDEREPAAFSHDPTPVLDYLALRREYRRTPLVDLDGVANHIGVSTLQAKVETDRMGLGSFKALGGAYAVASLVLDRASGEFGRTFTANDLIGRDCRRVASEMTFICASAGNHGLSVASGASFVGARAVVYLPETAPPEFAARLKAAGAKTQVAGAVYEDSMARACSDSERNGWILVSDSSWPGYTDIPSRVMQGYCVLMKEVTDQTRDPAARPSHVFLQAGVGGLAAAAARYVRENWGHTTRIVVVEPESAACLMTSVRTGAMTPVTGPVSTMGRLDCKESSLLAYESLRHDADAFVAVSDTEADESVALLAEAGIETTPSGAAGLAGLRAIMSDGAHAAEVGLNSVSTPLILVTEGSVAS